MEAEVKAFLRELVGNDEARQFGMPERTLEQLQQDAEDLAQCPDGNEGWIAYARMRAAELLAEYGEDG